METTMADITASAVMIICTVVPALSILTLTAAYAYKIVKSARAKD